MPITIDQFKQAFAQPAGESADLKQRDTAVAAALKQLKHSIDPRPQEDASTGCFREALRGLVERYDTVRKQSANPAADAATELDRILAQSKTVIARLETPVATSAVATAASGMARAAPAPAGTAQGLDVLVTVTVVLDGYIVTDGLRSQAVGPIEVESPVGTHQLDNKGRVYVHVPANTTHRFTVRGSHPTVGRRVVLVDVGMMPVSREVRIDLGGRPEPVKSNEPAVVPVVITVVDDSSGAPLQDVSVHGPNGSGRSDKTGLVQLLVPMFTKHWIKFDPLEHESVSVEFDVGAAAVFREVRLRKDSFSVRLTVKVVDERNRPIENASVDNYGRDQHRTDASGRVTMPFTLRKSAKFSKFQVAAHGYRTGELNVYSGVPDGSKVTTYLVPVSKDELKEQEVRISVVEARGLGEVRVEGAKVTIGRETKVTSEDGSVVFDLLPGRHAYTATADGFVEARGQIDVYQMRGHDYDWEKIALMPLPGRD